MFLQIIKTANRKKMSSEVDLSNTGEILPAGHSVEKIKSPLQKAVNTVKNVTLPFI